MPSPMGPPALACGLIARQCRAKGGPAMSKIDHDALAAAAHAALVRGPLGEGGHPYAVIGCGIGPPVADLTVAPRRDPAEVIQGRPVW